MPADVKNDPVKKKKMRRMITKAALDFKAFDVNELDELDSS